MRATGVGSDGMPGERGRGTRRSPVRPRPRATRHTGRVRVPASTSSTDDGDGQRRAARRGDQQAAHRARRRRGPGRSTIARSTTAEKAPPRTREAGQHPGEPRPGRGSTPRRRRRPGRREAGRPSRSTVRASTGESARATGSAAGWRRAVPTATTRPARSPAASSIHSTRNQRCWPAPVPGARPASTEVTAPRQHRLVEADHTGEVGRRAPRPRSALATDCTSGEPHCRHSGVPPASPR